MLKRHPFCPMRADAVMADSIPAFPPSVVASIFLAAALTVGPAACGKDQTRADVDSGSTHMDGRTRTDGPPLVGDAGQVTDGASEADGSGHHQPLDDGSCTDPSPPHTDMERTLRDMPADSWYQAPNSHMRTVCPDIPDRNCAAVITAWSGGAYDPLHNRMLVFGGGHNDYPGNELYAFDLQDMTWSRLTDPSPIEYKNQDPLPDGHPVSRHSYNGLAYIVRANRFFALGGSRWQDGWGTHVAWTFDSDNLQWENREADNLPDFVNCCNDAAAYDPATGLVFIHITDFVVSYDYDNNRYQILQNLTFAPLWPRYALWGDKSCTVDTRRHLLWCLGSGLVMVYDIENDQFVTNDWATTGGAPFSNEDQVSGHPDQIFRTTGGEVITAAGPGLDYDPVADDLVAWVGGGPWILDLETKVWHQGSDQGAPTDPVPNGTFGRWRYVPRTNVFILVNSVDDDVWFYKHTTGCGETQ